ncbi:MAG: histidine--tRNA ligase [Bdellovibrionaceae bacterium]|nr:histidine--tRNA ligase [Pseudobdellovibrionaceae bacterium]MDW8190896.1 histidine--tRNA ligase [Pseudobdellovibrionaceae bacterium]
MKSGIPPLRGMEDIWGERAALFHQIETVCRKWFSRFNYQEMRTPLLESSEVFHRTLGETSDAVQKETYTFTDRSGDSVTLRPEGTASVVRALIANDLIQHLPQKFFYYGPMFRHERPQKGRLRQFHQIGVEALGYRDPWSDVETIALAYEILIDLGISDVCRLEINSLGDSDSRRCHRALFVDYLMQHREQLSPESKLRLEKNPLRIFDSKDENDRRILKQAPLLKDHLNDVSKAFFDQVLKGLTLLGIPFEVNPYLVRGFDYYHHSVFEFTTDRLGSQSAILSGGRYDQLVEEMGGPHTPAVGWALGVERIELLILQKKSWSYPLPPSIAILPLDQITNDQALLIAQRLRKAGWRCELMSDGKIAKRIQKAEKRGFSLVAFLGPDELREDKLTVKDLGTGNQTVWSLNHIPLV